MKSVHVTLLAVTLVIVLGVYAAANSVVIPSTLSTGDVINTANLNANFTVLRDAATADLPIAPLPMRAATWRCRRRVPGLRGVVARKRNRWTETAV